MDVHDSYRVFALLPMLMLAACGDDSSSMSEDAAIPQDASREDQDAFRDESDAGPSDAGYADSATDAGAVDAGPEVDASPDAMVMGCQPPAAYTPPDPATVGIPATGLVLWLRADLGVGVDGDRVCTWEDLSGSDHDFAQTAEDERPTLASDDGSAEIVAGATERVLREDVLGIAADSGRTFFLVASLPDPSVRVSALWQGDPGSAGTYYGFDANTFNTVGNRFGVYVTNNAYDSDVATTSDLTLHTLIADDMTPGEPVLDVVTYRVDGAATTLTRTAGGSGDGTVEDTSPFERTWIGSGQVELREVLIYDRPLAGADLESVESYLQGRHSLDGS